MKTNFDITEILVDPETEANVKSNQNSYCNYRIDKITGPITGVNKQKNLQKKCKPLNEHLSMHPTERNYLDDNSDDEDIVVLDIVNLPRKADAFYINDEYSPGSEDKETKSQTSIPALVQLSECKSDLSQSKLNTISTSLAIEEKTIPKSIANTQKTQISPNRNYGTAEKRMSTQSIVKIVKPVDQYLNNEPVIEYLSDSLGKHQTPNQANTVIASRPVVADASLKANPTLLSKPACTPLQVKGFSYNQFIKSNPSLQEKTFRSGLNEEISNVHLEKNKTLKSTILSSQQTSIDTLKRKVNNDSDSTTVSQNKGLNESVQKTFGNDIKQQIRYVTLPAKFLRDKTMKETTFSTGNEVFKIVKSNFIHKPANTSGVRTYIPGTIMGGRVQPLVTNVAGSVVSSPSNAVRVVGADGSPVLGAKKIVFVKNNPNVNTSNVVEGPKKVDPPSRLLLNNKIINLKGIQKQESLIKNNCIQSSANIESAKPNQCLITKTSTSVEKACQTDIYSWIYKNSKLYRFVDDEGQHVEQVPVETVRVEKPTVETNVGSPASSLDEDSDIDEEISVSDEPIVSNNITQESYNSKNSNPVTLQSINTGLFLNASEVRPEQYSYPQNVYQPENSFQQVPYSDFALYNSGPTDPPEINASSNQNINQNYTNSQYNYENLNTVYDHEKQMFYSYSGPCSQNVKSQPTFEQPPQNLTIDNPTNNSTVAELFNQLVEDIKTCLHSDGHGNMPIHQAVLNRDLAKLKRQCLVLKTIGSDLNYLNLNHDTALMLAVKVAVDTDDYEAVSMLIMEGADQQIVDQEGNTPLHVAVMNGCEQLVRLLLSASDAGKVTEKFNYDGLAPLHIAAMEGYDDIIRLLISTSIDINIKDRKTGRTPYFLAVKEDKATSAELLMVFGADVHEPNFAEQTPPPATTPEKGIFQTETEEVSVGDPDETLRPVHKFKIAPGHRKKTTTSQVKTGKNSFVLLGRNETSLDLPIQIDVDNKQNTKKIKTKKCHVKNDVSTSFDVKELYDKYVKIAEKRKQDNRNQEVLHQPSVSVPKNVQLSKPVQNVNINDQIETVDGSCNSSQSEENDRLKNNNTHQPLLPVADIGMSSDGHELNKSRNHNNTKLDNVIENNINNDAFVDNKTTLASLKTSIKKKSLNTNNIGFRVKEHLLSQAKESKSHLESSSVINRDGNLPLLNQRMNCSSNKQSSSKATTVSVNSTILSVEAQPPKKNKIITSNRARRPPMKRKPNKTLKKSHLPKERKQNNQLSCTGLSHETTNRGKKHSGKSTVCNSLSFDVPLDTHNTSISTMKKNEKTQLPSKDISLTPELSGCERSNPVINTSPTRILIKQSSSKATTVSVNSTILSVEAQPPKKNKIITSNRARRPPMKRKPNKTLKKSHLPKERKQNNQLSCTGLSHETTNRGKKHSGKSTVCNSLSFDVPLDTHNTSISTMKKKEKTQLPSKDISLTPELSGCERSNPVINTSPTRILMKHDISSTTVPTNTLKTLSIKMSESKCNDETNVDSQSKESDNLVSNFDSDKKPTEQVLSNIGIFEKENNHESDEDDNGYEGGSINMDFGNIQDVILGNSSFYLSNNDQNESDTLNLLEQSEKVIQLSFGTLFDDIENDKSAKKYNSSQKINSKFDSSQKQVGCDESEELKRNTQNTNQTNIFNKETSQSSDSNDLRPNVIGSANDLIFQKELPVFEENDNRELSSGVNSLENLIKKGDPQMPIVIKADSNGKSTDKSSEMFKQKDTKLMKKLVKFEGSQKQVGCDESEELKRNTQNTNQANIFNKETLQSSDLNDLRPNVIGSANDLFSQKEQPVLEENDNRELSSGVNLLKNLIKKGDPQMPIVSKADSNGKSTDKSSGMFKQKETKLMKKIPVVEIYKLSEKALENTLRTALKTTQKQEAEIPQEPIPDVSESNRIVGNITSSILKTKIDDVILGNSSTYSSNNNRNDSDTFNLLDKSEKGVQLSFGTLLVNVENETTAKKDNTTTKINSELESSQKETECLESEEPKTNNQNTNQAKITIKETSQGSDSSDMKPNIMGSANDLNSQKELPVLEVNDNRELLSSGVILLEDQKKIGVPQMSIASNAESNEKDTDKSSEMFHKKNTQLMKDPAFKVTKISSVGNIQRQEAEVPQKPIPDVSKSMIVNSSFSTPFASSLRKKLASIVSSSLVTRALKPRPDIDINEKQKTVGNPLKRTTKSLSADSKSNMDSQVNSAPSSILKSPSPQMRSRNLRNVRKRSLDSMKVDSQPQPKVKRVEGLQQSKPGKKVNKKEEIVGSLPKRTNKSRSVDSESNINSRVNSSSSSPIVKSSSPQVQKSSHKNVRKRRLKSTKEEPQPQTKVKRVKGLKQTGSFS